MVSLIFGGFMGFVVSTGASWLMLPAGNGRTPRTASWRDAKSGAAFLLTIIGMFGGALAAGLTG